MHVGAVLRELQRALGNALSDGALGGDRRGSRLLDGDAPPEPRIDGEIMLAESRGVLWAERDRRPDVLAAALEVELLRHHAKNRVGRTVHLDHASDGVALAVEVAHPQPVAEYR